MGIRFWFRGIFAPPKNTASQRLQQLTGELALMFAGLAGCGSLVWYTYGVPPLVPFEGAARTAITKKLGLDLYMSPCILFQERTLKLYSTLDGQTGDCYCFAVDYNNDQVYSAKLQSNVSLAESKDRIFGARRTYTVEENKREVAKTRFEDGSGPIVAMGRWWAYIQKEWAEMTEVRDKRTESMAASTIKRDVYVGDTLYFAARHLSNAIVWSVTYPMRVMFTGTPEPEKLPKVRADNPSTEEWKGVIVNKVINGVPVSASGGRSFYLTPEGDEMMVAFEGKRMYLTKDPWTTQRVRDTRSTWCSFLALYTMIPSFFIFGKWWFEIIKLTTHDAIYKNLVSERTFMAKRFGYYSCMFCLPLRAIPAFALTGHYLYEQSLDDVWAMSTFFVHNVVVEFAAVYWVLGYALRRAQPKSLAVIAENTYGKTPAAPQPQKVFVKRTKPQGNITMADAVEHDLVQSVAARKIEEQGRVEDEKHEKWAKMLKDHDEVQRKAVEAADRKLAEQKRLAAADAAAALEAKRKQQEDEDAAKLAAEAQEKLEASSAEETQRLEATDAPKSRDPKASSA